MPTPPLADNKSCRNYHSYMEHFLISSNINVSLNLNTSYPFLETVFGINNRDAIIPDIQLPDREMNSTNLIVSGF